MSAEEYWHGDVMYPRAFREANRLKRNQSNFDAWLQGMYVYEAMCAVAPVMNAFAKKGTRVKPYAEKPYDLYPAKKTAARKQETPESEEEKQMAQTKAHMEMLMHSINMGLAKKEAQGAKTIKPEKGG